MSLSLIRWENQTVTPKHDSIQWDTGKNGIINGCSITHLGANQLRIAGGYISILGRLIEVSQMDINVEVATSGETNGQMFIRMDLASDVPVEIVTEATENLTPLTQNKNANFENGVYELLLATYRISETTISNLEIRVENIGKIEDEINQINTNLTHINVYVGEDEKLHFVDSTGADTALPFSNNKKELLWTNPKPSADFAGQTVNLPSGYEEFMVEFYVSKTSQVIVSRLLIPIEEGQPTNYGTGCLSGSNSYTRTARYTEGGIIFSNGRNNTTSSANNVMIPVNIYGFKKII